MRAVLNHAIRRQAIPVSDIREIPGLIKIAVVPVPIDEPICRVIGAGSRGQFRSGELNYVADQLIDIEKIFFNVFVLRHSH